MDEEEFYVLDAEYFLEEDEPIIRLIGVKKDGSRIIALDADFKPYFYALLKEELENEEVLLERIRSTKIEEGHVLKAWTEKKNYFGKEIKCIKIVVNKPQAVNPIANHVEKIRGIKSKQERDIPFYKRYLMDKKINPLTKILVKGKKTKTHFLIKEINPLNTKIKQLNYLVFDLETYNIRGNVRPEKDQIMMISIKTRSFEKLLVGKKIQTKNKKIKCFNNEKEMLLDFIRIIKDSNPEVIIGYNSDAFDLPYLKERLKQNKIDSELKIRLTRKGNTTVAKITNYIHLDIFHFIKNILGPNMKTETYDLNSVAFELIKEQKHDINWEEVMQCWDEDKDLSKVAEYSLNDAVITARLYERIENQLIEITEIVGQPIHDICRMRYGQYVEHYLMKKTGAYNELIPNRPISLEMYERGFETYEGAYVHEPKAGLYENIMVADFKSLYPSIITSYNISPATLNCSCCSDTKNKIKVNNKAYWYCKKKEGFIPKIMEDLMDRRTEIKKVMKQLKKDDPNKIMLNARQYALKIILNATYGYYGFSGSRWYCHACAESITALGREYIKKTIEKAENKGFNVIYSDTDSILINLKNTKEEGTKFLKEINEELPGRMEIELEGIFPRGIFVSKKGEKTGAKKKYALINDEGELTIKGFEFVRRDWAPIAKKTQYLVFKAILKDKSIQKALEIVKKTIKELKEQKVCLNDLGIYTQLKKPIQSYKSISPHVAVAKKAMQAGYHVETGMTIKYIVLKGPGSISERSILFDEARELKKEYDADYYIEHQLLPAVIRIFEALNYNKEELLGKKQEALKKYF